MTVNGKTVILRYYTESVRF